MDFGYRSSNETGNGDLLDNVDPHIREVVKVAWEELPSPKLSVVPARANREHAIAMFGKNKVDEAVEPSNECIRESHTVGFRQPAAEIALARSAAPDSISHDARSWFLGRMAMKPPSKARTDSSASWSADG